MVERTRAKGEGGRKTVEVRNQGASCPQPQYLRCSNELESRTSSAELAALLEILRSVTQDTALMSLRTYYLYLLLSSLYQNNDNEW